MKRKQYNNMVNPAKKKRATMCKDSPGDAPSFGMYCRGKRRHARTWETLTVKYVTYLIFLLELMIPHLADTELPEVHFLLIQTK